MSRLVRSWLTSGPDESIDNSSSRLGERGRCAFAGCRPLFEVQIDQGLRREDRNGRLGRVEKWRGGLGEPCVWPALSVAGARTSPHAPFPLPARRTGQADCPHPALGQGLRLSPTRRSVCAAPVLPDARPGTGRRRGSVPSPDPVPCAWHTTTDAADDTRADRWLDRRG